MLQLPNEDPQCLRHLDGRGDLSLSLSLPPPLSQDMAHDITTPPPRDSFARFLRTIDRGRFDEALTTAMTDLVQTMYRLAENGNGAKPKGKIVVTLSLRMDKKALFIDPDMKVTAPRVVRAGTVLFPDAHGKLWDSDPDQFGLPLEGGSPDAIVDTPAPAPAPVATGMSVVR